MAQLHALIVGIDAYAPGSRAPTLRGCAADARAVHAHLTRRFGVPDDRVRLLVDDAATFEAVIAAWRAHLRDCVQPGDTAYVHFSGHGSQALSRDPDEADGLDETLVLWDSRLEGRSDLRDKTLSRLIDEVAARGAQMILFLDCCHSGGATRADDEGTVRTCPPDLRPPSAGPEFAKSSPTRTEARTASPPYLLLAACLDEEKARETRVDEGWHGAATLCFLRALEEATPETTWEEIYARVRAGIRSLHLRQTPQLTGPAQTLLWGGAGRLAAAPLAVLASQAGKVQVDGGLAVGLGQGARIAIVGAQGGETLTTATVVTAAAADAWATLDAQVEVAVASRARILSYGYASPVHPVRADDPDLLAAMAGADTRFVRPATGPGAPFGVVVEEGRYRIVDAEGAPLLPQEPSIGPQGAQEVLRLLEHLAIYRNVRSLRNRSASPGLASLLEVGEPAALKASRGTQSAIGQATPLPSIAGVATARAGERIGFAVTNRSDAQRLFVTVLRLSPDLSIRRVEPVDERQTTLPAGRTLYVRDRIEPMAPAASDSIVVYKVMATTSPVSFDALLLAPVGQGEIRRAAPVRDGGPLSALLDALRRTGTRLAAADAGEELWIARDVTVGIGA